jgi:hypothetical protein
MAQSDWKAGARYRVIKPGARLDGLKPLPEHRSAWQGWSRPLKVGEIITCTGLAMGWGSDSVPLVQWSEPGVSYVEFYPATGTMWTSEPDPSFLELVPVEQE